MAVSSHVSLERRKSLRLEREQAEGSDANSYTCTSEQGIPIDDELPPAVQNSDKDDHGRFGCNTCII